MRVLGQNLNDALNFQRSRIKGIYVEIMQKSKLNIIPYLLFGFISFLYGFGIYYMLPYSLLSMKLGVLLSVFFFILMGLLLGLTLLAMNLQRLLEIGMTKVLLFWERPSMKLLVLNNLKAHSLRNKLTSAIFSMSLAFIIFITVQFKLIILQQRMTQMQRRGSFPFIDTSQRDAMKPAEWEGVLRRHTSQIEEFTWIPMVIDKFSTTKHTLIMDLSRMTSYQTGFYAIQPNAFKTASSEFLDVHHQDSGLSIGEQLYTARGS